MSHVDHDGYVGPATVVLGIQEFEVTVRLTGRFEPVDGRYHWYGRLTPHESLARAAGTGSQSVTLLTAEGEASAALGDVDVWSRYRVEGVGLPPFRVDLDLAEVEG